MRLMCPNGYCALDEAECAGESDCPDHVPFRCADNHCVQDRNMCRSPIRNFVPEDIVLNLSPYATK